MKGGARKGAGRPKGSTLPPGKKRVKCSFTLMPDDLEWVAKVAKMGGVSQSKVVERAIRLLRKLPAWAVRG